MKVINRLFPIMAAAILATPASAKTWTSTDGRKLEAEIVRVDGDKVILKLNGRDVPLPISRLAAEDQQFVTDWQKSAAGQAAKGGTAKPAAAPAGGLSLCGTALTPGGGLTTVEQPLSEAALKALGKSKSTATKVRIGIALPSGFDPAKPQRVMCVSAGLNNDQERTAGNCGAMGNYLATATAAGWVVLAVDTDLGNPRGADTAETKGNDLAVHQNAVALLTKNWPAFPTWQFACCGFSGGAKATFYRVCDLLACKLNVTGMYLTGCNRDLTDAARDETNCPRGGMKKIKVWISNGKSDDISSPVAAEGLSKSMKSNFGKIRLELFDGGHEVKQEEFKKAVEWFAAPDGKA